MNQIDDLPIDPEGQRPAPSYLDSERPSWVPLALIVLGLVALGGLGWFVWQRSRDNAPAPATAAATPAADAPAAAPPPIELPPLEQMDPFLRTLLSGLSSHPQLLAWLATDDLLGSAATAIDRLAQGQSPARDLAPLRPTAGFTTRTARGTIVIDPASFTRYDGLAAAVASVEPARLVTVYTTIEPRLAEAWARQGHTGNVRDAVLRAAAMIASTPDTPQEIALTRRVSGYGYANPDLEALPPAQKHLLRMGPANVAKVREAASGFAAALAANR